MKARLLLPFGFTWGCLGPAIDNSTSTSSSTSGDEASTSTSELGSSESSSSGAVESSSTSGAGSSSSSTGDVLDGQGCNVTPTCEERSFEGSIRVSSLEDLAMLEGVTELVGTLEIAESDLECIDALGCLRLVAGDVRILDNASLRSTAGLAAVEDIGSGNFGSATGSVVVSQNAQLEVLEGFDHVRRIDGGITVWQNPALREVLAFQSLRRLELLSLNSNEELESLVGLHALERLEDCNVNQNATLCISEVFEVCGDVDPPADGVTNGNDDGC